MSTMQMDQAVGNLNTSAVYDPLFFFDYLPTTDKLTTYASSNTK